MANKLYIFFEYAYIVLALFFTYEAYSNWNVERERSYLFLGFVVVAIFMFFFKRNFRKKMKKEQ